tara:strand:- start:13885 stop:14817 length:933 start_codon:yes stop_codon:yes gene_type:complete
LDRKQNILILGSSGFLGKNVREYFENHKSENEITYHQGKTDLDLLEEDKFSNYIGDLKPDIIINCAAFVGGISYGPKYPAKLLHDNSKMILNIYNTSVKHRVKKLINPISNCAYPGNIDYYEEKNFWNGKPHESVFNYALTRRLIVAMGEAYYSQHKLTSCNLVLSNMYGKHDHFDEARSHALGAILDKVYKAKINNEESVTIWGTGNPIREWLYVEDGVKSLIKSIQLDEGNYFFNIGVNKGISIKELATKIAELLDWHGKFDYDLTRPDGAQEKRVEGSSSIEYLKWEPETNLEDGLIKTIEWYSNER